MATLNSWALTTLADVKETMGIASSDTSRDNLIIRKINQATEMIESFCNLSYGHHFKETTYTNEEYDGSGTNQLVLGVRPVTSVASFQYRGTTTNQDDWSDSETDLYFIDQAAGVLDLLFNQTNNFNRYRLTYTAGYSTIPADLAEACATLASYLAENSGAAGAVKRKREGQREIEYFDGSGGNNGPTSTIEQLGLDDVLARYINYSLQDYTS